MNDRVAVFTGDYDVFKRGMPMWHALYAWCRCVQVETQIRLPGA